MTKTPYRDNTRIPAVISARRHRIIHVITLLAVCVLILACSLSQAGTEVSGEYYDWQRTLRPEAPWRYDYSQTLVMKLFLCSRDGIGKVGKVYLTFEDALEVIRKLDNLTLGIPKIVYLVGWQFTGHDSGYPSWSVVNERLKRSQDGTALQSLKWLMEQAKQYHTVVSLHVNMFDAYENSPLWKVYDEKNVIVKDRGGAPIKGPIFDGMQSYQISYAQEWRVGLAQKRIDGLVQMLPELQQSGSIHIDAFESVPLPLPDRIFSDPYLRTTMHDETEAQRRIIRYWRTKGIDVTTNHAIDMQREDPYVGLVPMAWGFSMRDLKKLPWIGKPPHFEGLPSALYTGTPMGGELEIRNDPIHLDGLLLQFCTQVVPWYYRNDPASKDLPPPQTEGNTFLRALWRPSTVVACSAKGYMAKHWALPPSWAGTSSVKRSEITLEGLGPEQPVTVNHGSIELSLNPGEAILLQQ